MQIRGVDLLRKTSHSSLLCYLKHPICAGVEAVWVLVRRCHLLKPRTFWSCFKPRIHHRLPLTRGNCLDQRSSRDIWDIRIFGIFVIFLENFCRCGARPSISCLPRLLSVTSCETTLPLPPKNYSNYIHVQLQDYRSCYAVWPKMFLSGILCSMCLSTPAPPSLLSIIGLNCPQSSHRYPMEK